MISRTSTAAGIDPGRVRDGAVGFLTDTTLCIGCKACEVACKQWNQLPADNVGFTANSYDNTGDLGAETWRHVAFVERIADDDGRRPTSLAAFQSDWLMMSDVCKHCVNAGCMEACPTGAIVRTEFDTVYVQQDVCNGCGYCVPACPFGVLEMSDLQASARKCTLCYDRLKGGFEPACAKACPTDSIQFGLVEDLTERAYRRVADLHNLGVENAYYYGDRQTGGTGGISGLNASFILTAPPETYNLPDQPELPQDKAIPGYGATLLAGALMAVAAALSLRSRS